MCVVLFFPLLLRADPLSSILCKVRLGAVKRLPGLGTLYELSESDEKEVIDLMQHLAVDEEASQAQARKNRGDTVRTRNDTPTSLAGPARVPAGESRSGRATTRVQLGVGK